MARTVLRKSLLVLGLLVSVLGFSAAAAVSASAAIQPTSASAVSVPAGPGASAPGLEPAGGVCGVPGIGDILGAVGLCQNGQSGLLGDLNNICEPSVPQPEPANGGIDSIVRPPASTGPQGKTLYDNYGVAGQFWAAYGLQCSDMTSLIGNNVAGMVFDAAKAVDRVTITVYQSAAGNGILGWLASVVNKLITSLGNAIYFPYLVPVVLLGVMWMAWHGLIRKRATRTIEGTIWMVIACAAAIWLIGRPADFTGLGQSVSNGVTQVLNVAFSKLPSPSGTNCVPVKSGDPQSPGGGNFGFTQGNGMVDQNADELWSVLVCKPWLDGEFGTTQYATGKTGRTLVNTYGRQLLWAQSIAANEAPTSDVIQAKQATYVGIANAVKAHDPSVYPLFQGNQWTSRMEIGFATLFAALVAGVLVLLIAITLIILKLGFLLLLIAGPFFLIIGTHPGFGRVIAVRWVEMVIGVLLKQVAVALVLSVLLYAYSLIMGTSDAVLPWALKILMIALVTIAVFIYRKPFQHLFSAVGYGSVGARERAEIEMYRSREVARRGALGTAAAASGFAGYRVGRWSRRDPATAATLAEHIAHAGGGAAVDPAVAAGQAAAAGGAGGAGGTNVYVDGAEADGQPAGARSGAGGNGRARGAAGADAAPRSAPPLHLPSRAARGGESASVAPSGWARGGAEGTAAGGPQARAGAAPPPRPAAPRTARTSSPASPRPVSARSAPPPAGGTASAPPRPAPPRPASPGPASPGGSGRPLWRPGPIRASGGWLGGNGQHASPPPPPPARQAAATPPAYPYSNGAGGTPPRPSRWSRGNGAAAAGSGASARSSTTSTAGSQPGAQGGGGAPQPPSPFWLRPVRRKK
ncbi:MAG TPA: type IV secretion system protein [Streptosporangiaceae bacterium]